MVVVLVLFPIAVGITGAVAAGLLGALLKRDAEATHRGSELVDLDG